MYELAVAAESVDDVSAWRPAQWRAVSRVRAAPADSDSDSADDADDGDAGDAVDDGDALSCSALRASHGRAGVPRMRLCGGIVRRLCRNSSARSSR